MAYRSDLLVPYGYSTTLRTLGWLRSWLLAHHHPEYVERLVAWLDSKNGQVGVGGGWRAGGSQPDRAGFAPEGKSFHQDQNFNDGFCGAAAVDLVVRNGTNVHRAPRWSEVPSQGSAEAARWGVHANVSTESWHMQPVEIDGWQSWWNAGRPSPRPNYRFPNRFPPEDDVNWNLPDSVRATVKSAPPTSQVLSGQVNDWAVISLIKALQEFCDLPITGKWDQQFGETINQRLGYR